ncbi:alpha-1,2-fucosyltransferase [Candidatus Planktophila dulcis]|uniref:alpha-1,2-fucosyltransferase n=1 Tax=Candidatus Planktophila dulcis TaxID=1884914 RepID=UPI003CFB7D81
MKKKPLIVFLTGGLGNQLFQLANALTLDSNREIYLEWILGNPRCDNQGLPDLFSLKLPKRVHLMPATSYSKFASKTAGYVLRSGIAPKTWEKISFIEKATRLLGGSVLSIYFRRLIKIERGTGIGYSALDVKPRCSFIIGYFQSYRFTKDSNVFRDLKDIALRLKNLEVEKFTEIAQTEEPIVVHFRFGDYKLESSFGIPNANYYRVALTQILVENPNSKIWVFSDEEMEARKVFPSEFMGRARWFTDIKLSSAETLEIMRLGKSYVIANSTFSWWGAILSKTENPSVICPDVWFRFEDEPLDLIPPSWKRVSAWK